MTMTEAVAGASRAPEKHWYVIHTYSGYENKVKANLEHRIESMGMEDKIFQVLVPMEDEIEIRQGQRAHGPEEGLPGLRARRDDPRPGLLVRRPQHAGRHRLRRQRQHPGHAHRAHPARRDRGQADPAADGRRDAEVQRRLPEGPERARDRRPVRRVHRHGRRGQPRANKVKVLVSIFGRETPVELDFLQVEKL